MKEEIIRDPTLIRLNTIPQTPKLNTLKPKFSIDLRIKPSLGDKHIKVEIMPVCEMINMTNSTSVAKFQTSTSFAFSDIYDTSTTHSVIHNFIIDALRDFNLYFSKECRQIGLSQIPFTPPSFQDTLPEIKKAFMINNIN